MRRFGWRRMAAVALVAVILAGSLIRFWHSGVAWAFGMLGGDSLSAFPGPLHWQMRQLWPGLVKEWIPPKTLWNYGPALHILTAPLVLAPSKVQAMQAWLLASYLFAGMSFWLWVGAARRISDHWSLVPLLAAVWLNYVPLLEALAGRESELIELCLISVGMRLLTSRERLGGALIGVAGMVKFLPLILVPYLWFAGFRRAAWAAIATIAVFVGLGQGLLGWEHSITWGLLQEESGAGQMFPAAPANQAILNVLYKTFTVADLHVTAPQTMYPHLLHHVGLAINLLVLIGVGAVLARWRRRDTLELDVALLMITMVLVAPHANTYYLVLALPGVSLGLGALYRFRGRMSWLLQGACVAGVVCSGLLVPMRVWSWLAGVPAVDAARFLQRYSLPAFGAAFAALVLIGVRELVCADGSAARRAAGSA